MVLGQIETKLLHNFAGASCNITFPVDILFQDPFSSIIHELTVNDKMKDQQICTYIISSRLIISPGHRRYIVGRFYGNE